MDFVRNENLTLAGHDANLYIFFNLPVKKEYHYLKPDIGIIVVAITSVELCDHDYI